MFLTAKLRKKIRKTLDAYKEEIHSFALNEVYKTQVSCRMYAVCVFLCPSGVVRGIFGARDSVRKENCEVLGDVCGMLHSKQTKFSGSLDF